jgi:cation diffusion facilitator CzcD-associated flavoprotein CzcO
MMTDRAANDEVSRFVARKIRERVRDPKVADLLVPKDHGFGTRRVPLEPRYYEVYNQDTVNLVDIKETPIERITATGIKTSYAEYPFDIIIYATGFDAMTGALSRIDIRGRDGMSLREFWADEGPLCYLGLAVAGFPNLFIIQAPGSPAPASNFVAALEQHVDWIADCITYLRAHGYRTIDALPDAQQDWIEHTTSLVAPTVLVHSSCNSWYNGGNVDGKKRMYMGFTAGIPEYRRRCGEIADGGYLGFTLA